MATNILQKIATRSASVDFYSLGMALPNPDPVLKRQGRDIAIYHELLTDAHLGGCVQSRKAGTLSLQWEVDRNKTKSYQAEIITDVFEGINLGKVIAEMLSAPLYGYSVSEVIWEKAGKYILPSAIVGKPQEWFVFDEENNLRLKTKGNFAKGELLPDKKFLLVQHEASYKNPYGTALLSRCFWPVTFKRGGLKFWVTFSEKYGMPFVVGRQPRGTGQAETERFADQLDAMIQDAVAVIPDDASIEIKEAGGKSASADVYSRLLEHCETSVAIAILGQNLTTHVEGGSYAATLAHMGVRKDIMDSDKRLVERALNQLIGWIYEINFAGQERPTFSMWEEEDVDQALAQRDEKLTLAMERSGLRLSRKYFQENYGLDEEDVEARGDAPGPGLEYAEKPQHPYADQRAIDDVLDAMTPEELHEQAEDALKPIMDIVQAGGNYHQILAQLVEAKPEMNLKAIENLLARAMFVSEVWGRATGRR